MLLKGLWIIGLKAVDLLGKEDKENNKE